MSANAMATATVTPAGRTIVLSGGSKKDLVAVDSAKAASFPPASDLARRISTAIANLRPYYRSILEKLTQDCPENTATVCNFIAAEQKEINISDSTREWKVKVLVWLSCRLGHKLFQDMTKQDMNDLYLLTTKYMDGSFSGVPIPQAFKTIRS